MIADMIADSEPFIIGPPPTVESLATWRARLVARRRHVRCPLCGRYRGEKPKWPEGPEMSPMIHLRHRPDRFRYRGVTEHPAAHYSGLILAARITLPHFSVSSAINLPKSAGESASTSPPSSASRALSLGSARPALISLLSFSTISAGVFLGAPTPYHVGAS